MELSQGQIIKKTNKQELFSLFMTHRLNVMHAPVKFHKYIPYGLGVMARTRFTGLLVAHFENIGFYIGSSYSKYRIFTGFSIKNIG